ncbi:hypothetical protein [Gordonia rubripertincta]|uniref:Uncharacterized protein n=1 Tax=Gordonia rubripertincta TaxID=36822 RepID=A0ABT4MS77_GORRU|nr:hypothetical protein [Gordonia rubripertincta]MCZ4549861.1 hypothetical protein [Gordonia rubripertincta]
MAEGRHPLLTLFYLLLGLFVVGVLALVLIVRTIFAAPGSDQSDESASIAQALRELPGVATVDYSYKHSFTHGNDFLVDLIFRDDARLNEVEHAVSLFHDETDHQDFEGYQTTLAVTLRSNVYSYVPAEPASIKTWFAMLTDAAFVEVDARAVDWAISVPAESDGVAIARTMNYVADRYATVFESKTGSVTAGTSPSDGADPATPQPSLSLSLNGTRPVPEELAVWEMFTSRWPDMSSITMDFTYIEYTDQRSAITRVVFPGASAYSTPELDPVQLAIAAEQQQFLQQSPVPMHYAATGR